MSRGSRNHIWYRLLDEEGVPISDASIWLYLRSTMDELVVYDVNDNVLSQPLTTSSNGVLEFFVKDRIGSTATSGAYYWDDQYVISWSKDDKSGIISGDHLFGEFKSVDENGNLDRRNRAISDYIGWLLESHATFQFGTTSRCRSSSSSSSSYSLSSSSSSSSSSESSSSSSSSSSESIGWWEATDDTYWEIHSGFPIDSGTWVASAGWWKTTTANRIYLQVKTGTTWNVGFEPTRLRITHTANISESTTETIRVSESSVSEIEISSAYWASFTSPGIITLDFSNPTIEDLKYIYAYAVGGDYPFTITKIEFDADPGTP